jgi:ABC-type Na+ transport system ATPase subunit NatA
VRVGHGRTAPPGSAAKDHDAIPTPDDKSREDIGRAAEDVSADALISFDGVWQLGRHRGPQRAGETTLLRIAIGILAPDTDTDTVTIDGLHSHRNWREYHRRLGFYRPGIGVCMHGSACEAT